MQVFSHPSWHTADSDCILGDNTDEMPIALRRGHKGHGPKAAGVCPELSTPVPPLHLHHSTPPGAQRYSVCDTPCKSSLVQRVKGVKEKSLAGEGI